MPALQVRDFPDDLYEELRECAANESRSIAQQAVYILKEYLGTYSQMQSRQPGAFRAPNLVYIDPNRNIVESVDAYKEREQREADEAARQARVEKRKKLFEQIRSRPQAPLPDDCPSPADIVRQGREERADQLFEALEER